MQSDRTLDHKIWGIAWPAILSNITIPLLGLVDAAILGHLGSAHYLGAVALGSAILSFLYWGFSFLRMGTTGLVARALGAGEERGAFLILARSGVLALALACAVILLHPLWLGLGFRLMAPGPELLPLAQSYAGIRIASAPAVLLTYAVVGWCIGRQDTRWPMAVVITTNAANIALDFLFIVGLDMYSDGAAMATVCAEYLGLVVALTAVWRRSRPEWFDTLGHELRRLVAYRALLQSNRHLFLRTVCLLFSFAFFTAMGEKLGQDILAANAIMMQLMMVAAFGLDGFAFAAEGLAGNSLGAGDLPSFHAAVRRCAWWCGICAAGVSAAYLLAHPLLFAALTDLEPVRELMFRYRWWLIALPLVAAPCYLLDGVFIGSAETGPMMRTMLLSTCLVYLPCWYLTRDWGNHGLWLAFTLFNAARGLSLYRVYRRYNVLGRWLNPQNSLA